MKNRAKAPRLTSSAIADPGTVFKAAKAAPRVFSIASYFNALYLMREKGHSWRFLSDWLTQFNIKISHVHLHRLFVREDERLKRLSRKELLALGMPPKIISEMEAKTDPTKRLAAGDPEDEPEGDDDPR